MRRWWLEKDYSDVLKEEGITAEKTLDCIVAEIQAKVWLQGVRI